MMAIGHIMLRRTFFAVFLFIFCVTLSYTTEGAGGDAEVGMDHRLVGGKTREIVIFEGRSKELKEKVKIDSFRSPALIVNKGKVGVVAEARYTNTDKGDYVGIVLATLHDDGKLKQISAVLQDGDEHPFLLSPTVIVETEAVDDDVIVYFGAYCRNARPLKRDLGHPKCLWEPRMLTGNIKEIHPQKDGYIEWHDDTETNKHDFGNRNALELIKNIEEFIGSGGAGIRMENEGKYVFPVQALYTNGSTVSLIITSSDAVYEWEFSDGRSDVNCINPAVLEFNEGELLMITSCETGHYKVYKSTDIGEKWTAVETLSGVWGTNKERNGSGFRGGFVKANIDKTNVVFFTQPVKEDNIYTLHLWVTNMKHIYDVGRISADNEDVSASSLLYQKPEFAEDDIKNVKFYCAYEVKKNGESYDIAVVDLKNKLEEIKTVVKTWKEVDKKVAKRFCPSEKTNSDAPATECKDSITEGLVGYLSKESLKEDGKWDDEYLCVNTTASQKSRGADSTSPAAGNEFRWPPKSDEQNQLYHFANKAFTLVATVIVPSEADEKAPLLGVVFKNPKEKNSEGEKRYELSYSKNGQWLLSVTNGQEKKLRENIDCTADKQYQVVLSRKDAKLYVYIDGKPFQEGGDTDGSFDLTNEGSFSHFYFGAYDNKADTGVTVKDVFLYNRHLEQNETQNIKEVIPTVTKKEQPEKQGEKKPQATSHSSSEKVEKEVDPEEGEKQSLKKEVKVDSNSTTDQEQKRDAEKKQVVPPPVSIERPVVVSEREKMDDPTTPAAATTPDGSVKNEEENEDKSRSSPVKEETVDGTPRQGITQEEHEAKKGEAGSTATVFGGAGNEPPAADDTSLREKTNAGNDNNSLKTLLETTNGDGAVRSCASLLPSLCLWFFLTAFYCCQAVAA